MNPLTGTTETTFLNPTFFKPAEAKIAGAGFQAFLQQSIQQVDQAQKVSDQMTAGLISGRVENVHEVMIAAQKASLSLDLTMQVRNKMVEAYQEVMRMQV
ncbi:flagellar hook-basal body complex protein FliE [Chryseomicrobium aureum]|uniref:flagellar hook-basal body complex protein FliE n=1 Tax=Chryseomicrobium aureum TaxID=1441723 RepID=UPI00195BB544|nr:flagellar hook-basal body complex protein FliE [Chryseomicrobium aureum]MBM7705981.1 flagellar hook-basal body complex protein FliE [Chryseomicrobium aureum]